MVKKTCPSCRTRNTPRWRGDLCNACYLKRNRASKGSNGEGSNPSVDPPVKKPRICESCNTKKTPKWRGSFCNACYLSHMRGKKKEAMDGAEENDRNSSKTETFQARLDAIEEELREVDNTNMMLAHEIQQTFK